MAKIMFKREDLPQEFLNIINGMEAYGKPTGWLLQVVDTENPHATFVKDGKPWYRSGCHKYEGYWLDGGLGSVQCKSAGQLIPGMFWQLYCKEECWKCPYCKEER